MTDYEIRPFLGDFPLTPKSLQVSVGFLNERCVVPDSPYIASVIMRPDQLEFNHFLKKRNMDRFDRFIIKPLKECRGLLPFCQPKVKREPAQNKPAVPLYSEPPEREDGSYGEAMFGLSKKFALEKTLYLTALGEVCEDFESSPFQMALWGHHCLKLNEARHLTTEIAGQFLQFVKTDPKCLERIQFWHKDLLSGIDTDIPDERHISLRLSFWDKNIDRQPEPYIAEVRLSKQKVIYYTADENQVLKIVLEEPLNELQKLQEPPVSKEVYYQASWHSIYCLASRPLNDRDKVPMCR